MKNGEIEIKKLEYTSAQEMLKHYDSLNWQIGAVLIAATIVLTGMVLQKETVEIIKLPSGASLILVFGVPSFSLFILAFGCCGSAVTARYTTWYVMKPCIAWRFNSVCNIFFE
ncbi:MAG: hypothetical protein IPK58_24890 [Acidobacteria bacterium]|nr:hypothetical protein [Acidobacteriota bacterium]